MKFKIREATKEDAYGVEYVAAHSWKETYSGLLSDEYLNNRVNKIDNNNIERINKTKEYLSKVSNYYVLIVNEKIIGILYVTDNLDNYKDYGHMDALYILKEYQGYGLGKELFNFGIKRLIDMGYNKMQLECMKGNKILSFYQKYGGYIVDTIDYPIKDEIVKADIILFDDIKDIYEKINRK